ncbi:MAG: hypothetical protein QOG59_2014, partial [Solirubrobacteraceae bacterium]|nr:hypothetical protein [Solirubrobacteraceae bacterium]
VLLMQVLSRPPSNRPTVYAGTAADIRTGSANPSLGDLQPPQTTLQATIVPNGVARVVFSYPGQRPSSATATIRGNVGIANPVPPLTPSTTTWYAKNGSVIRSFTSGP